MAYSSGKNDIKYGFNWKGPLIGKVSDIERIEERVRDEIG